MVALCQFLLTFILIIAPTSAEKILENFPHPTIEPIISKPVFEILAPAHVKLNANAASA